MYEFDTMNMKSTSESIAGLAPLLADCCITINNQVEIDFIF